MQLYLPKHLVARLTAFFLLSVSLIKARRFPARLCSMLDLEVS